MIGAGTMGRRLAVDFARCGHEVILWDTEPAAIGSATAWCGNVVQRWCDEGRVPDREGEGIVSRISAGNSLESALQQVEFAFENVPERLDLKRATFAAAAPFVGPSTILVSNTSSLPGSLFADATGCPERLINANFGHLGHLKVEVMSHPGTLGETRQRVVAFLTSCGFEPLVLAREQFGYASNRIWRAVKKEVLRQLDAGIATAEMIDRAWQLDWGVTIGPCALMDRIGLDVVADIEAAYANHFGDANEAAPPFLHEMIRAGKLGVKSGEGFYRYHESPAG
jgi:3-hydroxybutyryl-CoA dehydrogenase